MRRQKVFLIKSSQEIIRVAEWLRKLFLKQSSPDALVIGLVGELGAGKTTLVKALCRACQAKSGATSPSFVLLRTYSGKDNVLIHHLDAWRIKSPDMNQLGFKKMIKNQQAIVCVEWADRVRRVFPKKAVWLYFEHLSFNQRRITAFYQQ
jgi:tRNA threonylcarbamoyladenosine biosynthesis protein TsaE